MSVTAVFKAGILTGSSGCNGYSTAYALNGSKLTISSQIRGTLVGCPAGPTAVEQAYRTRLPQVKSYEISGQTLTLFGSKRTTLLVYDGDRRGLRDRREVDGDELLHRGPRSSRSRSARRSPRTSRTVRYRGRAAATASAVRTRCKGSTIKLGPFRSTLKACTDPVLQTQEQKYLAALGLAASYEVTATSLQLFRADGGIAATFDK